MFASPACIQGVAITSYGPHGTYGSSEPSEYMASDALTEVVYYQRAFFFYFTITKQIFFNKKYFSEKPFLLHFFFFYFISLFRSQTPHPHMNSYPSPPCTNSYPPPLHQLIPSSLHPPTHEPRCEQKNFIQNNWTTKQNPQKTIRRTRSLNYDNLLINNIV